MRPGDGNLLVVEDELFLLCYAAAAPRPPGPVLSFADLTFDQDTPRARPGNDRK